MSFAPDVIHPAIAEARRARAALARQEAPYTRQLVARYARLSRELDPLIDALIAEYEVAFAAGETLTKGQITRLERYRALQQQMLIEMQRYGEFSADLIGVAIEEAVSTGTDDALRAAQSHFATRPARAAIANAWNRLPVEAVENAIGITETIARRYDRFYGPAQTSEFMGAIVDAMVLGKNPRVVADIANRKMGIGLTDALRQSRTGQIWSWREATRANYAANPRIVTGWIWSASLDERTCMSCLANHGKEFPLSATLNDHHNGRCVMIPQVPGAERLGIRPVELPDAEQWFNSQDREAQIKQMGKGKLEAYENGQFRFGQLTKDYSDEVYGTMRREATLKELTAP